jgi:hypothetical protein
MSGKHWLDKVGPRVQSQMETLARKWWIKSLVESRRRPGQDLEGVVDGYALRSELERAYETLYEKHAHRQLDGRTSTHVSTACLCLATYACLSRYVQRDRLLEIIREQTSQKAKPALQVLLRWTSFMTTYGAMQQRLKFLDIDRGTYGFSSRLQLGAHMSTLRFTRCLYEDIFREEGKPELLGCVCCSADRFWFESQKKFKAGLKAPGKADGSRECMFYVISQRR